MSRGPDRSLPDPDEPLLSQPVETLIGAYVRGYFPMAVTSDEVFSATGQRFSGRPPLLWVSPEKRGVMPLTPAEGFHVPRRLADRLRTRPFVITSDVCFSDVMMQCALPRPGEDGTWIDDRLIRAYTALHEHGLAHSVEAWGEEPGSIPAELRGPVVRRVVRGRERVLVGGTYGVRLGAAFFAESKFHRPDLGGTDASKICLVALVRHLSRLGVALCDTQFVNDHIARFGCREIPRDEYLRRLGRALQRAVEWRDIDDEELWLAEPGAG